MRTCSSCATEVGEADRFCTACGAPLAVVAVLVGAADDPPPPIAATAPPPPSEAEPPPAPPKAVAPKAKVSKAKVSKAEVSKAEAPPKRRVRRARRTSAAGPSRRKAALVASGAIVVAAAVGAAGLALSRRHAEAKPSRLLISPLKEPASKWRATVKGVLASATVDLSTMYVVTSSANDDVLLTALALADGSKRWEHGIAPAGATVSIRPFAEGIAVASTTTGESLLALYDKATGAQRWRTATDDAFRFDFTFPGPYVVAKDGEAQALGRLDLAGHKVARTVRGTFSQPFDGKLALLSERRVSIVAMSTLDRTGASMLVDDKVAVVAATGTTVVTGSGRDLVGYDDAGKELFAGRLTVGAITRIDPLGGSRYAVAGADGTSVVAVSGRNVDTLWDSKKAALLAAETLGDRSYVLVSRPDPVRLVLVDTTKGQPQELGTTRYVNDGDRGPFAFIATKGVVTISNASKLGHVAAFDLGHLDKQWEVVSAADGFADVVDRGAITYTVEPGATVLEYHA
jgi:PQQ-like domain